MRPTYPWLAPNVVFPLYVAAEPCPCGRGLPTRGAVELRVVPTDRFCGDVAGRLTAGLVELLGPGAKGRVVAVDDIGREASGTRLAVKSALDPPEPAVRARP